MEECVDREKLETIVEELYPILKDISSGKVRSKYMSIIIISFSLPIV